MKAGIKTPNGLPTGKIKALLYLYSGCCVATPFWPQEDAWTQVVAPDTSERYNGTECVDILAKDVNMTSSTGYNRAL